MSTIKCIVIRAERFQLTEPYLVNILLLLLLSSLAFDDCFFLWLKYEAYSLTNVYLLSFLFILCSPWVKK